ncbi:endo-1,4-beta-xylanase A [Glaciecola sp. KUL10]|nr:endo-1,4-beta-xylanase A [Glaciecola sp. KUL10]
MTSVSACGVNTQSAKLKSLSQTNQAPIQLKNAFAGAFDFGVAINRQQASESDSGAAKLINEHFAVLTAENDMKWESIQPIEGQFIFEHADKLIEIAQKNGQKVIGHALIWHEQVPNWVFEDEKGNPASSELLLARMRAHISAIVGRYKGKIHGWDVVNEALNDDGTPRDTKWRQILGDKYIEYAFNIAHEIDPDAKLYYNDYSLFKPTKREGAIKIANRLRNQGIKIDGIGAQGHYLIDVPIDELEASIIAIADNELDVMITELDISVLKFPEFAMFGADVSQSFALQSEYNPFPSELDEHMKVNQANAYTALFEMLLKHQEKISRVTMWGLTDGDSWKNNWPMKGRTDYALIIDRNNQVKPFMYDIAHRARLAKD